MRLADLSMEFPHEQAWNGTALPKGGFLKTLVYAFKAGMSTKSTARSSSGT